MPYLYFAKLYEDWEQPNRSKNLQLFHFTRDNNVWDRPQVLVGKDNATHTWSSSIWMNRFSVACCLGIKSVLASQNHIRREFPKYVEEKGSSTLIALASHYPGCCEPSAGVTSCWTSLLHPCLLQQIIKVDIFTLFDFEFAQALHQCLLHLTWLWSNIFLLLKTWGNTKNPDPIFKWKMPLPLYNRGSLPTPKRIDFQKSFKGGGGHFHSKNLYCRFLPL